jgi:hypothetical protein
MVKRSFKQVGKTIVVKQEIPATVLSAKDVLDTLNTMENNKNIIKNNISKLESDILVLKDQIKQNKERDLSGCEDFKNLVKFKDWAEKIQISKFKNLVEEVSVKCKKDVLSSYKFDNSLTEEENNKQMFVQFKHFIATNPELVKNINNDLLQSLVWKQNIIKSF